MPERGFDPLAIIAALDRHGTRYVLIGGMASRLHGAPLLTEHPQLVPATDPANLRRLADALRDHIITSKAAADRPEDRLQLDVLRDLRDELRRRGQRS